MALLDDVPFVLPRLPGPSSSWMPALPRRRGALSAALIDRLATAPLDPTDVSRPSWPLPTAVVDPLVDDDLQLTLHVIYELSYRGFFGVDERWEWDPQVIALRRTLEDLFEEAVRRRVDALGLIDQASSVGDVLARFAGPSLSAHMERRGTLDQFREFTIHRSAYQLKEADPHSWAIPRVDGARKAALIEIQADEYGNGRPGEAHAELFAAAMKGIGLDPRYGEYLDQVPGVTLATGNLISMFGMQRRLRAALLGHLAGFEMTSVVPMTRYAAAAVRCGLSEDVLRFYLVHIEADEHHGQLAASALVGGDPAQDGLARAEILFGAAALLVVEDLFARHLLRCWGAGVSSLRAA